MRHVAAAVAPRGLILAGNKHQAATPDAGGSACRTPRTHGSPASSSLLAWDARASLSAAPPAERRRAAASTQQQGRSVHLCLLRWRACGASDSGRVALSLRRRSVAASPVRARCRGVTPSPRPSRPSTCRSRSSLLARPSGRCAESSAARQSSGRRRRGARGLRSSCRSLAGRTQAQPVTRPSAAPLTLAAHGPRDGAASPHSTRCAPRIASFLCPTIPHL